MHLLLTHLKKGVRFPFMQFLDKFLPFLSAHYSTINGASFCKTLYQFFEFGFFSKFVFRFCFDFASINIDLHECTVRIYHVFSLKFVEDAHQTYVPVYVHFDFIMSKENPLIHYYP